MAVSTAATISGSFTSLSSFSMTVSIASTNDYVLIGTGVFNGTNSAWSSVSVGSTTLAATLIGFMHDTTLTGNESELWLFPARLGTTGSKVINFVAPTGNACVGSVSAVVLTGVNSTTPYGTPVQSTGKSSRASVIVGSSLNDLVVAALAWDASVGSAGLSSGTSEKIVGGTTIGGEGSGLVYELGAAGNITIAPSIANASAAWTMVGININASSGGAAPAAKIMRGLMGVGR